MSFLEKVDQLTVWSQDGRRAPHKPLLLLLVLGRRSQRLPDEVSFAELEGKLTDLLVEFGPLRQAYHPEYPFWRLQQNGIWEVTSDIPLSTQPNANALVTELRQNNAHGRLSQLALDELTSRPRLLIEASGVTSKPANGGHRKSGQWGWPGTVLFYPFEPVPGKPVLVRQLRGPHLRT